VPFKLPGEFQRASAMADLDQEAKIAVQLRNSDSE
jgi:hypothetical protein